MATTSEIFTNRLAAAILLSALTSPLVLAATGSQSATAGSLTLREAVTRALESNPMLRSVRQGQAVASARVGEARAARLPLLEFAETYTHSNNPVFAFGSLLEQGRFTERNFAIDSLNNPGSLSNFRSALNLKIPVFNRFQVASGIEQAKLGEGIASETVRLAEQQVRFHVIEAYYGILVSEAREKAAAQAVETAEAETRRIRDLVDKGLLVSSDLLATEVQLAEFRQRLIQAKGDVATAYAGLSTALGEPVDSVFKVSAELRERQFTPPAQADLIRQAIDNRPELEQSRREVEIAEQKLRAARGQYWPDFNLFAQFGHSSHELINGSGDFAVGARLSFNVVDFGRRSRVEQAQAEQEVAKSMLAHRSNLISLEAVRAFQDFTSAEQRLSVAAGAVQQASETLRIVRDRHGAGLTEVTELLRAQTALLTSEFNLLGARYDYYLGYARILLVSGALTETSPFEG